MLNCCAWSISGTHEMNVKYDINLLGRFNEEARRNDHSWPKRKSLCTRTRQCSRTYSFLVKIHKLGYKLTPFTDLFILFPNLQKCKSKWQNEIWLLRGNHFTNFYSQILTLFNSLNHIFPMELKKSQDHTHKYIKLKRYQLFCLEKVTCRPALVELELKS